MSVRGDIVTWCVERLQSEVPALRDVRAVADPEELDDLARNPPSAAVLLTKVEDSDTATPPGETYAYFHIEVWYFTNRFGATAVNPGVESADGIYELADAIHAAFKYQFPTGCAEPLRFLEGNTLEVESGQLVSFVEYVTALVI